MGIFVAAPSQKEHEIPPYKLEYLHYDNKI
jgi:hypothetical protein